MTSWRSRARAPTPSASAAERRRWDLSVAIARTLFPDEGGPIARFYAATAIYESDAPTGEEPENDAPDR
jgi:hypothetical protein